MLKPLIVHLNCCRIGKCCGCYYADATSLPACHNRRINTHKVFKDKASRGKTSTEGFYGFKLFLVVNAFGQIIKVMFTPGYVADNNVKHMLKFFDKLRGWIFADKGFIHQNIFEHLWYKGLKLVNGIRKQYEK